MLPKFEFKTADVSTARRFVDVCVESCKFFRTADSKILWGRIGDWVHLQRAAELFWLLTDGATIDYRGPTDDETMKFLWKSLENQKFRLSRADGVRA